MAKRSDTLHVEVVTAERELYNGEADLVSAPSAEGRIGILPQHAALLTLLVPGELRIKLGGEEEPLFVSGGFLEVFEDTVTILADTAEHAGDRSGPCRSCPPSCSGAARACRVGA